MLFTVFVIIVVVIIVLIISLSSGYSFLYQAWFFMAFVIRFCSFCMFDFVRLFYDFGGEFCDLFLELQGFVSFFFKVYVQWLFRCRFWVRVWRSRWQIGCSSLFFSFCFRFCQEFRRCFFLRCVQSVFCFYSSGCLQFFLSFYYRLGLNRERLSFC